MKSLLVVLSLALCLQPNQSLFSQSEKQDEKSKAIQRELDAVLSKEKIPGIVAVISSSKGILAISSAGVRKTGTKDHFTNNDLVHLGSCTKAMTSVLMGILVADKKLNWETTLIEVLPELKDSIHSSYHDITLWQLLTHRAGVPANAKNWWILRDQDIRQRRLSILKANLKDAPSQKRGDYLYSNLGYMIAGCMAEKLTDMTWESLIQKKIFTPLGMSSASFGPPGTRGKTDQPWGHNKSFGIWRPRQFDNAEALGPAGRVHCTVEDWAKFLSLQLSAKKRKSIGLPEAIAKKLITPVGNYGGGWIVTKRPWGKGTVLTHSGSNTFWYATVWVAPEIDRAFIVVTNSHDDKSNGLCDQMIGKLIAIDKQ